MTRESLLAGAIVLPLAMLFACVSASGRKNITIGSGLLRYRRSQPPYSAGGIFPDP